MRLALAGLILVVGVAVVVVGANGPNGEERVPGPSVHSALGAGLLVTTPPGVLAACRSATSLARMPARCPSLIAAPDGALGRARALDESACQYLIDVEPGGGERPATDGPIYHLLFGGRCRPFDLRHNNGRWPVRGFLANDLRLVGRRPVRPGESGTADGFAPARPDVIARMRIGASPALMLRYRPQPLTTVHTGHLAIVWNEARAGYTVSGHVRTQSGRQERRALEALRAMALAMQFM